MNFHKLIIKYTDNELSLEERKEFEMALQKDVELMKAYQKHLKINGYLKGKFMADQAEKEAREKGVFDLVDELEEENEDEAYINEIRSFVEDGMKLTKEDVEGAKQAVTDKKGKVIFLNKRYYMAAAVAAILIIVFGLWQYVNSPVNNLELFASYYQPYYFVLEQTRGSENEEILNEAIELYDTGKYTKALKSVNELLKTYPKNVKAHFLSGLILIETENFPAASETFDFIIKEYDSYNLVSKWYLAICYLKLEKPKEAKKLFEELSSLKNVYQKRALEILEEL